MIKFPLKVLSFSVKCDLRLATGLLDQAHGSLRQRCTLGVLAEPAHASAKSLTRQTHRACLRKKQRRQPPSLWPHTLAGCEKRLPKSVALGLCALYYVAFTRERRRAACARWCALGWNRSRPSQTSRTRFASSLGDEEIYQVGRSEVPPLLAFRGAVPRDSGPLGSPRVTPHGSAPQTIPVSDLEAGCRGLRHITNFMRT